VARKLFLLDGQSMTEDASELIKAPNQITLEVRPFLLIVCAVG
jgi:hypothetical protein